MKKLVLLLAIAVGFSISSFAQSSDGGKFSIGLEAGLPLGNVKNAYSFIIGGSLKYDHPIADATFITGSAGYTNFIGKDINGFKVPSSGFIPVKAGLKYFFAESFYGEGQLGAVFSTDNGGGTAFAYSPGVGYAFGGGIDLGVRYEGWSKNGTVNQVAARLAYSF